MRVAEFHKAGAFRVFHHAALKRDRTQLVWLSAAWPHEGLPVTQAKCCRRKIGCGSSRRSARAATRPSRGGVPVPMASPASEPLGFLRNEMGVTRHGNGFANTRNDTG